LAGHCKQLTPHYAKAATALKSVHPEVVLAKVDADKHKELGTKFGVKGFPTLKWFTSGTASEYNGGRTDDTIVSWIKKRLGPATKSLTSTQDHDEFVGSAEVVVVGYFESPKAGNAAWDTFVASALEAEGLEFGSAEVKDIHDHAGFKEGQIVLHKKADGGQKVVFDGDVTAAAIKNWVGIHQLAYVTDFAPETSSKIFGSPVKSQVLLFVEKTAKDYETLRSELTNAAKDHHGKTVAVYVSPDQKQVLDYFGEAWTNSFRCMIATEAKFTVRCYPGQPALRVCCQASCRRRWSDGAIQGSCWVGASCEGSVEYFHR
jgi:protein disulfide-isomerase A1